MNIQYKNIKDNSDFFLPPIPKWVTHCGFMSMVLIGLVLVLLVISVRYPEKSECTVLLTKTNAYTLIDFETYRYLEPNQIVVIKMPITGKVNGTVLNNTSVLMRDRVMTQLAIQPKDFPKNIIDTVFCKAEIAVGDRSILKAITKK